MAWLRTAERALIRDYRTDYCRRRLLRARCYWQPWQPPDATQRQPTEADRCRRRPRRAKRRRSCAVVARDGWRLQASGSPGTCAAAEAAVDRNVAGVTVAVAPAAAAAAEAVAEEVAAFAVTAADTVTGKSADAAPDALAGVAAAAVFYPALRVGPRSWWP